MITLLIGIIGIILFLISTLDLFYSQTPACPTGKHVVTIGWLSFPIWFVILLPINIFCFICTTMEYYRDFLSPEAKRKHKEFKIKCEKDKKEFERKLRIHNSLHTPCQLEIPKSELNKIEEII